MSDEGSGMPASDASDVLAMRLGGFDVEVWRRPSSAMPAERVAALLPDFWDVGLDGFTGMAPIANDEVVTSHCLNGDIVAYLFDESRCRALFGIDVTELAAGRMAYFSNAAIHSSLRGRGLYPRMILVRLALARAAGATWWSARTQNPLVAQSYRRFGAYPFDRADAETLAVAAQMAEVLFADYTDGEPQPGRELDAATGVLRRAYPIFVYDRLPDASDDVVTAHFARHLRHEQGDAQLLVGRLDDAVELMGPRSEDLVGRDFDDLVRAVAAVAAPS